MRSLQPRERLSPTPLLAKLPGSAHRLLKGLLLLFVHLGYLFLLSHASIKKAIVTTGSRESLNNS
ncbi:hypothetical protein Y5S_03242, partial [Alcanivorax nanhaiticus]